jgi:hypothetical protein
MGGAGEDQRYCSGLTSFDQLPHCLLESHLLYYNFFHSGRLSHGSASAAIFTSHYRLQFGALLMYSVIFDGDV